ncbi:ribosome maturation factor RimP [Clostridium intestinale]|jgi:ribosome maturation factor RimP|uniref:Ribosome maturation factor RimP n=1 Tax=Clostridium intestinale TaxID=36845 RepID=A0A7D6ZTB2_9CLOT|nr:ribosome maturation factor RimP [Clostridium intestinale]QLY82023.1 ribosome maturation factor RimP [Clostridium intestinale]
MKKIELEDKLKELIKPLVDEQGYEFYHVEYVKENNEYYLRVYIDSDNGISLSDCEKISRLVSSLMDESDPIEGQYYLEVSSPGIDRQLFTNEHMLKSIDSKVVTRLLKAINGEKVIKGTLSEVKEDEIVILRDNNSIIIPKDKIKSINIEGEI